MMLSFSLSKFSKTLLRLSVFGLILPLSACLQFTTQQGNVLKPEKVANIHKDDSRFNVESQIGSPVLKDALHPNRAIYMEVFDDPDSGKKYKRRVEIFYSDSGRVIDIKRFGFEDAQNEDGKE